MLSRAWHTAGTDNHEEEGGSTKQVKDDFFHQNFFLSSPKGGSVLTHSLGKLGGG